MKRWTVTLLICISAVFSRPSAAQDPHPRPPPAAEPMPAWELPPAVARRLVDYFNAAGTIHFSGPSRVPADRRVVGDVAVLGGPFQVAGRVEGDVVVINGSLELLPGAAVTGDVTVVGGTLTGLSEAQVDGAVATYTELLRYRRRGEQLVYAGRPAARDTATRGATGWLMQQDFLITTGPSYNRVEGLPVTFGPVIETTGSNPLRIRALAIYRSESGLRLDLGQMGYYLRAEQFLGGQRTLRIGAALVSTIDPIEAWQLTKLENGLATFLLHRDYRDHYEREGWSLFATLEPRHAPVALTVEGRSELHGSVPVGSPWTLFRNDDAWRPQPLVAEGRLESLTARVVYDTRSQAADPATGWHLTGEVERSLRARLTRPEAVHTPLLAGDEVSTVPAREFTGFTAGALDLRRYNRLSPEARLNFRVRLGGSLDGATLPPQRQHALGGEGSLPAYELFRFDCGARADRLHRVSDLPGAGQPPPAGTPVYFAAYGCDAMALFQAEFRSRLGLRLRWNEDPWGGEPLAGSEDRWWEFGWLTSPDWVAFVDAGRGWAYDGGASERIVADFGLGLAFSRLGLYLAVPLVDGKGVNLFVRLGPRF